jgi:hypothetical protein
MRRLPTTSGQMLHAFVRDGFTIENRAIGGRTARRFIDDGVLDEVWQNIHKGDYLLVQFGTNDGNRSATYTHDGQTIPYYLEPALTRKPRASSPLPNRSHCRT